MPTTPEEKQSRNEGASSVLNLLALCLLTELPGGGIAEPAAPTPEPAVCQSAAASANEDGWSSEERVLVLDKCEQGVARVARSVADPEEQAFAALTAAERVWARPRRTIADLAGYAFRAGLHQGFRLREKKEQLPRVSLEQLVEQGCDWPDEDHAPVEKLAVDRLFVEGLLAELTPRQRAVLHARYVLGQSYAETAARLGISENDVRNWLYTAKKKLRERMG